MAKAMRMYKTGGPEVMVWEDHDPGQPGRGWTLRSVSRRVSLFTDKKSGHLPSIFGFHEPHG